MHLNTSVCNYTVIIQISQKETSMTAEVKLFTNMTYDLTGAHIQHITTSKCPQTDVVLTL